ncbi:hypothetical protein [Kineococcus terrestris]|uniref:hypothetical protein n=1 Tax=Kineococcus terrestris TaxID=2044856 RepID=UPI0034DAE8FF
MSAPAGPGGPHGPAGGVARDEHGRPLAATTHDVTVLDGGAGGEVPGDALLRALGRSTALAPARTGAGVRAAAAAVLGARVVLAGPAVPDGALAAAAELCTGLLVLRPAARSLPPALRRRVDLLVARRADLAALAGGADGPGDPGDLDDVVARVRALRPDQTSVVVGAGAGAVVVTPGGHAAVPLDATPSADAVADAFADGLVDGLLGGLGLVDAVRWAGHVAARAAGTAQRGGPPHRDEVGPTRVLPPTGGSTP